MVGPRQYLTQAGKVPGCALVLPAGQGHQPAVGRPVDLPWHDIIKLRRREFGAPVLRASRAARSKKAAHQVPKSDGFNGLKSLQGESRGALGPEDALPEGGSYLCDNGQDLQKAWREEASPPSLHDGT